MFSNSLIHAPQPFIAFAHTNREREVPSAQARMAVFLDVHWGATRPTREIEIQLLARLLEARGVQSPDVGCLGRTFHQIVKAVNEPANAGVSAHKLVVGHGCWLVNTFVANTVVANDGIYQRALPSTQAAQQYYRPTPSTGLPN